MTRTDLCVNKPHKSRSYLNHLVIPNSLLIADIVDTVLALVDTSCV